MAPLTQASRELFRRTPDERFDDLQQLHHHCRDVKERCRRIKEPDSDFSPDVYDGGLALRINDQGPFRLNEWSFSQLCGLARVAKDTVNRLHPATAADVFSQTLGCRTDGETDLQALVQDDACVRAINGERYKRLWNADLVELLLDYAADFTPPQKGYNGATGLYAGEQDAFCFLLDAAGWTEIHGQAFAPGFFVWNSEVGKRTVGISTFWFQAVCANHIVWEPVEVKEVCRRHTGKARDALLAIREAIEALVAQRDARRDGFARVVANAMATRYGDDADDVLQRLTKAGFGKSLADRAIRVAEANGPFTIWAVVDALTQLARESKYAATRTDADAKASALLALAV